MIDLNEALFAAVKRYADLLATPHSDIQMWRRSVLRAKWMIAILSRAAEMQALEMAATSRPTGTTLH